MHFHCEKYNKYIIWNSISKKDLCFLEKNGIEAFTHAWRVLDELALDSFSFDLFALGCVKSLS